MRYLILFALLAVAACGAPPRQWGDNPEAYAELARDNVAAQCLHDYPDPPADMMFLRPAREALRQACERQGFWDSGLTHNGRAWRPDVGSVQAFFPLGVAPVPVVIVP